MPARDIYHNAVRRALEKDGWTITDDPLHLEWGGKNMYVDLGAEQVLGAEKQGQKIAVEIKSFLGPSEMKDLEQALGQFSLYRTVMAESKPDYSLYLAVPQYVVEDVFQEPLGQLLLRAGAAKVIGFDPILETVTTWIL
jgi:hypothetical protein